MILGNSGLECSLGSQLEEQKEKGTSEDAK